MRPIRATPSSDEPSDRTGGPPVRTEQGSSGSAPPHCESCPRQAARGRAWAPASETLPAGPVPAWGPCRRPPRPAPAASCGERGTGRETPPPAGVLPGRAARPRFDRPRSQWLRSPLLPTAGRGRHRLSAAPSRSCRAPRGWAPAARPFWCWRLGAVQHHLLPGDPLQGLIPVGQLAPSGPQGRQFHPEGEPALPGFGRRKARRPHPPPESRYQAREQSVQTGPIVVGRTAVATPDPRRKTRRKERPPRIGHFTGKVRQLQTSSLPLCTLDPVKIMQVGGFVS
jgi:hypothetical protein